MTKATTPPDQYALAAQRLKGMPENWEPIILKLKDSPYGNYIEVSGATPVGFYRSGPRKDRPKFPHRSKYDIFLFTHEEIEKVMLEWETEAGSCFRCGGDGLMFAGWSKTDGNRYRQCSLCGGTGHPPTPPKNTND